MTIKEAFYRIVKMHCVHVCAGGGRAGSLKKDFYKTNVKTEELKEILK